VAGKNPERSPLKLVSPSLIDDDSQIVSFILWFPSFFGLSVFAGIAIMRLNYVAGITIIYLGLMFLILRVCVEPWLVQRPMWLQIALLAILFVSVDWFSIGMVWAKAPLDFQSYAMRNGDYQVGTVIAGIDWDSHLTDLRLAVTNSSDDGYENLDLTIQADQWIYKAAIFSGPTGCDLSHTERIGRVISIMMPKESGVIKVTATRVGESIDFHDSSGNAWTTLATDVPYRLTCGKVPSHSTIQIVFAAVKVRSQLLKGLFPPNAPKLSDTWDTTVKELTRNAHSKFDLLDSRPSPSVVGLTGRYAHNLKPFKIAMTVNVADGS
jgi:hypothetical protein